MSKSKALSKKADNGLSSNKSDNGLSSNKSDNGLSSNKSDNGLSSNKSDNVLLDLVETIKDDNIISTKKGITAKCCASVKHTTKENSLNDLNNGLAVYLTKKDTTGKNDIFASYVQCSKCPNQEGNTLCHIHSKMNPEKLIKMENLIKTSFKASIEHEYYGDMGIRGAKGNKKNSLRDIKQPYSTKNINYILDSDNIINIKKLEKYAGKLVIEDITESKKESFKSNIVEKSNNELLEFLEKKNEENNSNELEESDIELVESDNENNLLESSHQETIDENEDNDDEEEGVECVEITTINGTTFYLDESSSEVYKIVEDQNILVGKLKEITEKYFQINHKDKKYSIFCEETKGGKTYLKCYLTGKKFDLSQKPLK